MTGPESTLAPIPPQLHPRRLARWALMFPAAIGGWILWQQMIARLFYGGVLRGGLTWVEGSAEGVFVVVAALVAPARKRIVAAVSLAFFICRDIATIWLAPAAGAPSDAAVAIAFALVATAVVWWLTRGSDRTA